MSEDLKPVMVALTKEWKALKERLLGCCATQGIQNNEQMMMAAHLAKLEERVNKLNERATTAEQRVGVLEDLLRNALDRLTLVENQLFCAQRELH